MTTVYPKYTCIETANKRKYLLLKDSILDRQPALLNEQDYVYIPHIQVYAFSAHMTTALYSEFFSVSKFKVKNIKITEVNSAAYMRFLVEKGSLYTVKQGEKIETILVNKILSFKHKSHEHFIIEYVDIKTCAQYTTSIKQAFKKFRTIK